MDIIILHRNLRLEDNSALFYGSLNQNYKIIYVYDSYYWSIDGRSPRQFSFLIDVESHPETKNFKNALKQLEKFASKIKILGFFEASSFRK